MSDHWHKHYHGRILNSYAKLPADLRGVAYTLLDLIYDAGGPLADADGILAARMCCSLRMWRTYKSRLLELGKFRLTADGRLTNKLCEEEIFKRRKQSEFGAKGGRTKAENEKTRKQFKDGKLGTLQGTLLANQKLEVREEPKGSSSEAKASGADAPFSDKKFCFDAVIAVFVRAGELEGHGRSIAGKLWNKYPDAVESVLTEILASPPAEPSTYFGGVFKRLNAEARKAAIDAEPLRPFKIVERDGRKYRVDRATGKETEIGRAA